MSGFASLCGECIACGDAGGCFNFLVTHEECNACGGGSR